MGAFTFPRPTRNYWRETDNAAKVALEVFTPQMYVFCMGTGILAILMKQNPYQFKGLETIACILFVLDILLFALITITFFTRCILFPRPTWAMFETDIDQTTYLSAISIASSTLIELVALIPGQEWHNWQYVALALWWASVLIAMVASVTVYWILIRDEEVSLHNLSPSMMYPVTGVLSTASAGSVVVSYTPLSTHLSMSVVVVSYLLLGLGFYLALMTLTAYFTRLLTNQTPEPKKIGAQFIPVAALANISYAFNGLGYAAGPKKHIFEYNGKGNVASAVLGEGLYATGLIFGLISWGFAIYWIIIGLLTFFSDAKKSKFSLYMWSAAYPIGIFGVACSQFATDFDSPAFRVITAIILVCLVIFWLWLVLYTLPMIISGELLLANARSKLEEEEEAEQHIQHHNSRQMDESRSSVEA